MKRTKEIEFTAYEYPEEQEAVDRQNIIDKRKQDKKRWYS